ncbi:MAG: SMI1/KNR4 family protein [Pirellulaceae bacterium]|nr:SMI1/KNR4 family protein [Pirellulaceae bacterium]
MTNLCSLEEHFCLELTDELREWFTAGPPLDEKLFEFHQKVTLEELLDLEKGVEKNIQIWPGFLPPDTLPLLSNGLGDWLLLRVLPSGEISEVICWRHSGGDWVPWGRTLAEALLFDTIRQQQGVAQEDTRQIDKSEPAMLWCLENLPLDSTQESNLLYEITKSRLVATPKVSDPVCYPTQNPIVPDLWELLVDYRLCEVVARRDLCQYYLNSPLRERAHLTDAQKLNVSWRPDFIQWLSDTRTIPEEKRSLLQEYYNLGEDELFNQDWEKVRDLLHPLVQKRGDLMWVLNLAGWQAEVLHQPDQAIMYYYQAIKASSFTDESVRFRMNWTEESFWKFPAARLYSYAKVVPEALKKDDYLQILWEQDISNLPNTVARYWFEKGVQCKRKGEYWQAYQNFYKAGWDVEHSTLQMFPTILQELSVCANNSGGRGLARLAEMYHQALVS